MASMTKEKLILEANELMQKKGYSSFSYGDLSQSIGITKASIHHHFSTKDTLGEQVVIHALDDIRAKFKNIDKTCSTAADKITAYMGLFVECYNRSKLPLCCSLSAEMTTLPENIQLQANNYFKLQLNWLTQTIIDAIDAGEFNPALEPRKAALSIINLCQGASIVSRALRDPGVFNDSLEQILFMMNQQKTENTK